MRLALALLLAAVAVPALAIERGDNRSATGVLFAPGCPPGQQSGIWIDACPDVTGPSACETLYEAQHAEDCEWDGRSGWIGPNHDGIWDIDEGDGSGDPFDWGIHRAYDVDLSVEVSSVRCHVVLHDVGRWSFDFANTPGVSVADLRARCLVPGGFEAEAGRRYRLWYAGASTLSSAVARLRVDCPGLDPIVWQTWDGTAFPSFEVVEPGSCVLTLDAYGQQFAKAERSHATMAVAAGIDHEPISAPSAACGIGPELALLALLRLRRR